MSANSDLAMVSQAIRNMPPEMAAIGINFLCIGPVTSLTAWGGTISPTKPITPPDADTIIADASEETRSSFFS